MSWDCSSSRLPTRGQRSGQAACWIAGQIADGSLDPATGTLHIWLDIAYDLGYPE
ncbi:hypothetical protein [Streptomyces angustmyceticus]|uniref:hypothetical protein n=1 Tax=Streptomyces angustmyceticus TaxID=285578 RepID=UPI0021AED51C|nr:hypothetical protein [Streptomyces angustmyceticus]